MLMVLLSIRDADHSHEKRDAWLRDRASRFSSLAVRRLFDDCASNLVVLFTYRHELRACCLFRHSRAYREHRIANGAFRMSNLFRDFVSPSAPAAASGLQAFFCDATEVPLSVTEVPGNFFRLQYSNARAE
jgi:hypothetical protein